MDNIKHMTSSVLMKSLFILTILFFSFLGCDEYDIPGEGTIPDETPPAANFSHEANDSIYQLISFMNLSTSATDYEWDFGDGNTSTDENPTNEYPGEGSFTVSLKATDKLGVSNTFTKTVDVIEPEVILSPDILNPSFDIEGEDSWRDGWRNSSLGGVIQITDGPLHTPPKAAKLPPEGDRIGYQLITVLPETEYILSFYYTMKTSPIGTLTVAILAGEVTDPTEVESKTIESVTLDDQSSASTYVQASLVFNSGDNTEVAIYFSNVDAECRIDSFVMQPN